MRDAESMAEGYSRGLADSVGENVIFCHDDIELLEEDAASSLDVALQELDLVGIAGTDWLCGPKWIDAGPPHLFGQVAYPSVNGFTACIYGAPAPHLGGMQALDGALLAWRRSAILQIGWDCERFDGFHFYDLDSSFRAFQAGMRVGIACNLGFLHQSSGTYDEKWRIYADRFLEKHASSLLPTPAILRSQYAQAEVRTKVAVAKIMRPKFWTFESDAT